MELQEIKEFITTAREQAEERNFVQSVDVVASLKDLDLNSPEHKVDAYVVLPHSLGKQKKVAALVAPDTKDVVEGIVDAVIPQSEFDSYQSDSKKAKTLAKEYDYFMAQADIMPKVATVFGRYLGPRGKMPNPKLGSIINPKSNIQTIYERLQNTAHLKAKKDPVVQVKVGNEDMDDDALAENILTLYDSLLENLINERNNVKDIYLKLTMGAPVSML